MPLRRLRPSTGFARTVTISQQRHKSRPVAAGWRLAVPHHHFSDSRTCRTGPVPGRRRDRPLRHTYANAGVRRNKPSSGRGWLRCCSRHHASPTTPGPRCAAMAASNSVMYPITGACASVTILKMRCALSAACTWRTATWSAQPVRPDAVRRSSILVSAACWERAGRSSRMRPVCSSKTGCTPSRSAAQPARRGTLPLALRRSMLSTVPTRRTCAPHRAAEATTVSRSAPACAARAAASTTRPCPPAAVPVSATRTGTLALRDAWSAA
jgi:hypothetical protein